MQLVVSILADGNPLALGVLEGESPVLPVEGCIRHVLEESRSLKWERQFGGILHLTPHKYSRSVAQKYREGKMQSTLERELNVPETVVRKACDACLHSGRCPYLREEKAPP